jgi:membrane associated rhomboid family serine protease
MDESIDYAGLPDVQLIGIYGRLEPLRAPQLSAQIKQLLLERGFLLRGDAQHAEIIPSPSKLRQLIGVAAPIETPVFFGEVPGPLGWLQPARNDFKLVSEGTLEADGIYLILVGPRARLPRKLRKTRFQVGVKLDWYRIVNVEHEANAIRLEYQVPEEPNAVIDLWFKDPAQAAQLADVLPRQRTPQFAPQLRADADYQAQLLRSPPQSRATLSLLAANTLLFLTAALAGAGWILPHVPVELTAGANTGTLTLHGEWWRLFTAMFIHFGILQLIFNLWAIAAFGALAERILGLKRFLLVYCLTGIAGNALSAAIHPSVVSGGASGALFGLLGALFVLYRRNKRTLPYSTLRAERVAVMLFIVLALLIGLPHKGIDNAAHLGGLLTGLLLGFTL